MPSHYYGVSITPMNEIEVPTAEISSVEMCRLTGCSYRQLDYWTRARVIVPAVESNGPGSRRTFTERQVRNVRMVVQLAALGAQHDVLVRASMAADLIPEASWVGTVFIEADGTLSLEAPEGPSWAINLGHCISVDYQPATA